MNTTFIEGLWVTLAACVGVFMIGAAVEGYLFARINIVFRVMLFAGALLLIDSGLWTDIGGFVILVLVVAWQYGLARRRAVV